MCVNDRRSSLLSRTAFLGALSAAAVPLFTEPARALDAVQRAAGSEGPMLTVPAGLPDANRRAAVIASRSPFVRALTAQSLALAQSIGDVKLRESAIDVL